MSAPKNAPLVVEVTAFCDVPPNTIIKFVGSLPELGGWSPDAAPALSPDAASAGAVFRASLPVAAPAAPAPAPGAPEPALFEYKLAARLDGAWVWQSGPNRVVRAPAAPAAPGGAPPRALAVRAAWAPRRDGTACLTHPTEGDPWMEPWRGALAARYAAFDAALGALVAAEGSLDALSRSYEARGLVRARAPGPGGARGLVFREWAPGAAAASLVGDFNAWSPTATPLARDAFGVFSAFLPDDPATGAPAVAHNSAYKLRLVTPAGEALLRLPAYARYAVHDPALNELVARHWDPPAREAHAWAHARPRTARAADYARVPGVEPLPSRTDFLGPVRPEGDAAPAPAPAAVVAAPTAAAAAAAGGRPAAAARAGAAPPPAGAPPGGGSPPLAAPAPGPGAGPGSAAPAARADPARAGLRIYEAHVGMSGEAPGVSTYREFAANVVPRIAALGYNCVQLMAIQEHAYYGSFGYHVNAFLAPASRSGTPEELKALVDAAHGAGLLVIMDAVHSHASKNVNDGLNMHDGTDHCYFHAGAKGEHALWDSRLFDYAALETQRLLLSSLRMFVDEYRFDGFRFDGVTSMLYTHHGLGVGFSGDYAEYFGAAADPAAATYLQLANTLLHSLSPPALSIAEDVSGAPTLGRPVHEGGLGFDFRLAMALPDVWIKTLKEKADEAWDLEELTHTLVNRRWQEKAVAYAESHDQALVGDKTLAFWLMDAAMYWHMAEAGAPTPTTDSGAASAGAASAGAGAGARAGGALALAPRGAPGDPRPAPGLAARHAAIDRGLALHKLIRLLTYALGGEAWLNFMGNEFGHPEWVDFPRAGNGWSYAHARRQWSLVDAPGLLYKYLAAWDAGMHALEEAFPWLLSRGAWVSTKHGGDKVVVFDRDTPAGPLVFAFNLHPTASYEGYRVGAPAGGEWRVALTSDDAAYGGHGRVDGRVPARAAEGDGWNGRPSSFLAYLPARTAARTFGFAAVSAVGFPLVENAIKSAYPALFKASSVQGFTRAAGLPALITAGAFFWVTTYGFYVGGERSKFIEKAKKDGEKDVEARFSLPNLYVEGNTPNAKAFNCVQRSHQQALETITQMATFTAIAAAVFPVSAAANMGLWWYSRVVWSTSYARSNGDPSKRYEHPLAFLVTATVVGQFMLAVAAAGEVAGAWAAVRALF